MSSIRISAVDLLRLVTIASFSPEGTADEVVSILQRTALDPDAPTSAEAEPEQQPSGAEGAIQAFEKIAKPE